MAKTTKNGHEYPEEKIKKYQADKSAKDKEKRSERKKEKEQGTQGDRLLAFIDNIIRQSGYNYKTFAEYAGMTPQAIHWIFSVQDDCSLSKAQEIMGKLGFDLAFRLKKETAKTGATVALQKKQYKNEGVSMDIEGDIVITPVRGNSYELPQYLAEYPEDGRLAGMAEFIKENGYSVQRFAETAKISPLKVRYWFTTDDIKMSAIKDVAKELNLKITWIINSKK